MLQNNQKELILLKDLGMLYPKVNSKHKIRFCIYRCFCGNEFRARYGDVNRLKTKSCGCLIGKPNITHGLSNHRLYGIWQQMIQRTTNKNHIHYIDYGGRGITVCERWLNVANFIEDMYPTFVEGLTLDRKENDLGYSKDNCRWVTQTTQTRNTRRLISKNTTGYRGVNLSGNKYMARISTDNGRIYLGSFKTDIEAAKAYDKYVIDNNSEHTKNFI